MIYALFSCFQIAAGQFQCDPYPSTAPAAIYRTLEECKADASRYGTPDKEGHYRKVPSMWWECRGKHVDAWETQR